MSSNYAVIIQNNIDALFARDLAERSAALPAHNDGDGIVFMAFGAQCRISSHGIWLDGQPEDGPKGIIISLYALHAVQQESRLEPFKSFKEMPGSAPYAGAFANRTEQALAPAVGRLAAACDIILARLNGCAAPGNVSGDLAFVVYPLPKIALCYVCYLPDEDFPAGVTCLYSNNAGLFLPTDALADVGEYTTQTILSISGSSD